jgi:hypothetical protein
LLKRKSRKKANGKGSEECREFVNCVSGLQERQSRKELILMEKVINMGKLMSTAE